MDLSQTPKRRQRVSPLGRLEVRPQLTQVEASRRDERWVCYYRYIFDCLNGVMQKGDVCENCQSQGRKGDRA